MVVFGLKNYSLDRFAQFPAVIFAVGCAASLVSIAGCQNSTAPSTATTASPISGGASGGQSGSGSGSGSGSAKLYSLVQDAESRIEKDFRRDSVAGGIPNELLTTTSGDSSTATYFDGADSALFTGTYLAAQCLKLASSQNPYDRENALTTVRSLLGTAEIYAGVSGVPGLISRYVYKKGSQEFPFQETGKNGKPTRCAFGIPWVNGVHGFEEYRFCGATSRDQYHGFLLGLSTCQSQTGVTEIRNRAAQILVPIVDAIDQSAWKVPYGSYEAIFGSDGAREISSNSRLSFASMAMAAIPFQLQQANAQQNSAAALRLESLRKRLSAVVDDEYQRLPVRSVVEQGWWGNYAEYYGNNLTSLAVLGLVQSEFDVQRMAVLKNYFWNQFWLNTWDHQNSQFSFIAQRTLGLSYQAPVPRGKSLPLMGQARSEARDSLLKLLQRTRDDRDSGSSEVQCEPDPFSGQTLNFISALVKKVPIPELESELTKWSHIQKDKCKSVIPISSRPYAHYYWETNPFLRGENEQTANPVVADHPMSPAVDAVFAYWLGRSVGAIQEGE